MQIQRIDWIIIGAYFAINLGIGIYYRKRATGSMDDYFVSGRRATWWLAGTSMVATTFAADTPLAVTGLVAANGIAGNWVWWSLAASGMLTVFFYARLWRRAGVLTDVEFAEIRYSGKPAAFLRGFRALYLGLPVNLIIMGWVNLAMVEILQVTLGVSKVDALVICVIIMALTAFVSTLSGLWGVLVMDLFQFILKMSMVILLAVFSVRGLGGMDVLMEKLAHAQPLQGGKAGGMIDFVPDLNSPWMPLITFFVYISVIWWATWYPGAEPGGGGYVAQRIFSAKDERHSLLATFWFNLAHYAVRPWPWIVTALVAYVHYTGLQDAAFKAKPGSGYIRIMMDPQFFPVYLRGLMLAGFAAAYMSTIGTQLNWGASYLVNDFYRRFFAKPRSERHFVILSQLVTVLLMLLSALATLYMHTIEGAWKFLMAIGAGTGSVFILRWYWWRINAWSEVSAMAASLITSLCLQGFFKWSSDDPRQMAYMVLVTVAISTLVWLGVTLATGPERAETLIAFYRRVRPNRFGWGPVAAQAPDVRPTPDGLFNFFDWLAGCVLIYMTLFGVGKIIFGETVRGVAFLGVAALAGVWIYRDLSRRGWTTVSE
ncbi:MAG: Na+:solute symporter [Acidobacteria bacterium]|nr:Na+:solute symporter [Acidobacteriota bacterium]MBI3657171.1 Na+:solute symporter [Acidobacteriota bacterium]